MEENKEIVEEVLEEKKGEEELIHDALVKENEDLKKEIENLEEQNSKLKNDYARAYADTQNIQKRLNQEFDLRNKYKIKDFALDILPVIDNFERAILHASNEEEKKGLEMIYTQLIDALEKEGVTKIECLNLEYDSNVAQAVMIEEKEDVDPNIVIEILQNGYMLKDKVLRVAMVKVSK